VIRKSWIGPPRMEHGTRPGNDDGDLPPNPSSEAHHSYRFHSFIAASNENRDPITILGENPHNRLKATMDRDHTGRIDPDIRRVLFGGLSFLLPQRKADNAAILQLLALADMGIRCRQVAPKEGLEPHRVINDQHAVELLGVKDPKRTGFQALFAKLSNAEALSILRIQRSQCGTIFPLYEFTMKQITLLGPY
jgi:hypothetical protein